MKITVICATIPTTLTIVTPRTPEALSFYTMNEDGTSSLPRLLRPGTTAVIPVQPGAYAILPEPVGVTCDPDSSDHIQIAVLNGKTDPPEQLKLTLKATTFSEAKLGAFLAERSGAVPPPSP